MPWNRFRSRNLRARGITVHDPDGHLVLSANTLTLQLDLPELLRKLLLGTGVVTLRFGHARIDRAEVYLLPGREQRADDRRRFHADAQPARQCCARVPRDLQSLVSGNRGRTPLRSHGARRRAHARG